MTDFLLAQPEGVLRAHGVRAAFDSVTAARTALRGEGAQIVVGALPFDPRQRAALMSPKRWTRTPGRWQPPPTALPPVRVVSELPGVDEHLARVKKLVEQLEDPETELRKVVAARSVLAEADAELEPESVAARLATRHPAANVFAADLSPSGRVGATLIGATPELLVAKRGRTVTLRPLAGSMPRSPDRAADAEQAETLLASAKNREEHSYVIEWIRDILSPLCTQLVIPDAPRLIGTHDVWHLATPITATLRDPAPTALDLAVLLHPTPAVCGTPTAAALEAITRDEGDRGFYGGAVGWCDDRGDGAWLVAIRCAELSADRRSLRAYAGGGIVAASQPQEELDETTAKLRTFLGGLDCPTPPH
ncbi:isochorismate synthase [Nocardia higoensis]|uniref:isochorismate synthase n=1 Tax=Nocardia higoensis TaxID=228599 RepID=A0ABS0DG32_9NOCA|nr:isochorismate synthase [Nocardia higoensis]MBF6356552.1 isochorismate synthase [Nocardia higoensis]